MALWFSLNVNDGRIGHFDAVRLTGGEEPDDVNTYRVTLDDERGRWSTEVEHRYGDGAWELVRKGLNARAEATEAARG